MTDDEPLDLEPEDDEADGEPDPGTPDSAADKRRLRKQARRRELDEQESARFWEGVFASEVGRREMWAILRAAGVAEPRFGASPNGFPDPHATFFRAGVQSVSDYLLREWQVRDFAGVNLMLCEHDPRFAKAKFTKRGEQ